jgi:signal transduction histidine kinase
VSADSELSGDDISMTIHDLRNLLAIILNYSELIAEETADPAAVRADILEIRHAAERAIALTEKLPRRSVLSREPRSSAGAS